MKKICKRWDKDIREMERGASWCYKERRKHSNGIPDLLSPKAKKGGKNG